MKNIYDTFLPIYNELGANAICEELGLAGGTVKRWLEKQEVPSNYFFDLCRVGDIEVDYSQYDEREKDQFFTDKATARYCYNKAVEILSPLCNLEDYTFIEPSAGDGSFFDLMPATRRVGIDIEPQCEGVTQSDFLNWRPKTKKNICIGNPPFGLRGHLALKFINHAALFSDFVCFILPQLFISNGKGNCKNRVKGMGLIHSEVVDSSFYYPDGRDVSVNVVFQVWAKGYHEQKEKQPDLTNIVKLYSLSDGGTPGSTRNKQHLYSCDFYLPSTCFGSKSMVVYTDFEKLPHRRGYGIVIQSRDKEISQIMKETDWSEVAFVASNGAYNLRFEIIKKHIWSCLQNDKS